MRTITELRKYRCEWCGLPRGHAGAHVTAIRQPAWIRRMNEKGLPDKDMTGLVDGAFVPRGSGRGA